MHRSFLYTLVVRRIVVGLILGLLVLFLVIAPYEQSSSWLSYHQEEVLFEYRLQAFTLLKLTVVGFITAMWLYATQWNSYDVYLMSRSDKQRVHWSRFWVLYELSGLVSMTLVILFLAVELLLPYAMTVRMGLDLIGSMMLFVLIYNLWCLLLERVIVHFFGQFLPLAIYTVLLILSDGTEHQTSTWNVMVLLEWIIPDIRLSNGSYGFLFGPYVIVGFALLMAQTIWWLVRKQDAIQ